MDFKTQLGVDTFNIKRTITREEHLNLWVAQGNREEELRGGFRVECLKSQKANSTTIISAKSKGLNIYTYRNVYREEYYLRIDVMNITKLLTTNKVGDAELHLYGDEKKADIEKALESLLKANSWGTLVEYTVERIDYAINVYYQVKNRNKLAMDLMHRTSLASYKHNTRTIYPTSLYERNNSITYNIYSKSEQLLAKREKGAYIRPSVLKEAKEGAVIRYEVQVHKSAIPSILNTKDKEYPQTYEYLFSSAVAQQFLLRKLSLLNKSSYIHCSKAEIVKRYTEEYGTAPNKAFKNAITVQEDIKEYVELGKDTLKVLNTLKVNPIISKNSYRISEIRSIIDILEEVEVC